METVKTEMYKGYDIKIYPDTNGESPREWENLCEFHIAHRRYSFGDKNYTSKEEIDAVEQEAIANGDTVLPLYMYDHSGISISLLPFSCPFDSGQVGIVIIRRAIIINEHNDMENNEQAIKQLAINMAQSEVHILDMYLRGEVYYYSVSQEGEEDIIDNCSGYYGLDDAMSQAKESVDYIVKQPNYVI
jgi:hypothetical protein